jgi:peptidoglycan hydrolase CwlO-like protein
VVRRHPQNALIRFTLMMALSSACLASPTSGFAAPAGSAPPAEEAAGGSAAESPETLEAKEAEKAAVLAELDRIREELAAKVTGYVTLARRIIRTQQDTVEVIEAIAKLDERITQADQALRDRAVQLYRTDRVGMLEILLSAESIPQLLDRFSYVVAASYYDSRLVVELRLARQESMWLRENLQERTDQLLALQEEADLQREQIELDIAAQEARAASIGEDLARIMREQAQPETFSGSDPDGRFSPDTVIAESNFRESTSMSVADIQAFLDRQPGSLGSYTGVDYSGQTKSAAQMIAEASVRWGVSPKVVLVTLQKEQSLLSRPSPTQRACDWAMGCGKTDSGTISKYQGFGNQIWYGAASLSKNAGRWRTGTTLNIDGNVVQPTNSGTYALYKYTPHIRGTMSFWLLYWRYFGDPLG